MRRILLAAAALTALTACSVDKTEVAENAFRDRAATPKQAADSYYVKAAKAVEGRIDPAFKPKAKNVILFIGDGMGISTITAARIYAGQMRGADGESFELAMETLPHMALSRTYSHDYQVADSAATATAMVSGVKTRSK